MYGGRNIGAIRRHHHGIVDPTIGFYAYDDFPRADSPTVPGVATKGGTWLVNGGVWQLSSNTLVSSDGSSQLITLPGTIDTTVSSLIKGSAYATAGPGLVARFTDGSNYILVRLLNGVVELMSRTTAGSFESIATSAQTLVNGTFYLVGLSLTGSNAIVSFGGTPVITTALNVNGAALVGTRVGYRADGTGGAVNTFDQFRAS